MTTFPGTPGDAAGEEAGRDGRPGDESEPRREIPQIPEPIRRAMEAQAARTGKIDVAAIEEALARGDFDLTDEAEIERQEIERGNWRAALPDAEETEQMTLSEAERAMIQPSFLDDDKEAT